MGYINWNKITENIDMSFLNPLLAQIDQIYQSQWNDSKKKIRQSDPYGSSIAEERWIDAKTQYDATASKEKSQLMMDYYTKLREQALINQLNQLKEDYDQLHNQNQHSHHIQGFHIVNPEAISASPSIFSSSRNSSGSDNKINSTGYNYFRKSKKLRY